MASINIFKWFLTIIIISLFCGISFAQQKEIQTDLQNKANNKTENSNILRWKIYLNSLAHEAKSVSPEDRRAYAIADVADSYWEIEPETSRSMFISALDSAWATVQQNSKNSAVLNYVLSKATRRDSNLTKLLIERLKSKEKDADSDDISSTVANELLKSGDAKKAAQIAESFAPNGLKNGAANFFIFRLALQDIDLANNLHRVYLNKVATNQNIPLEWIISLGGYSFGYGEFYSIDKTGQLFGATFPKVKGLSVNPAVAKNFLNLVYSRLVKTIQRKNNTSGAEFERLNYSILFALEYLMPEVAKFSPETLPMWQQLQQTGMVGVTSQQSETIANNIQSIFQSRARLEKFEEPTQTTLDNEAEESLKDAEKLSDACQRDVIYSKAAISFSSRKNFKRALEIVEKISDLKQSDNVKEVIFYNIIFEDIKNDELKEVDKKLKKIVTPELSAILYAKLTKNAFEKRDGITAVNYVLTQQKLMKKVLKEDVKSGILFNLAAVLYEAQNADGQDILRDAIKSLNKQEGTDVFRFSVPIRVLLSCSKNDDTWYGGFISLPNSNIFDVIALYAKDNPDEAISMAEDVDDKITKIRLLAMISKIAISNEIKTKPNKTKSDESF